MVKSRHVFDEIELHEELKNTREKLCNISEKNAWVRDYSAKRVKIIQNTWELVGLQTLQITLCKYRNSCSVSKKYHNYENVSTNTELEFSQQGDFLKSFFSWAALKRPILNMVNNEDPFGFSINRNQRYFQNPVIQLRRSFLWKELTAKALIISYFSK